MSAENNKILPDYQELFTSSPADENRLAALLLAALFLEIVNSALIEKNMTRKALAARMGTSGSWLTQLFRGDKVPSFETLAAMASILDITFEIGPANIAGSKEESQPKLSKGAPPKRRVAADQIRKPMFPK